MLTLLQTTIATTLTALTAAAATYLIVRNTKTKHRLPKRLTKTLGDFANTCPQQTSLSEADTSMSRTESPAGQDPSTPPTGPDSDSLAKVDQDTTLPRETILEWFRELEAEGYILHPERTNEYSIRICAESDLCLFSISAHWPGEFPGETRSYLGCIASAKDGGGDDLHDGPQSRETWDKIVADIREFNQFVNDYPTAPMGTSPTLMVYPVPTQRRECTADRKQACPNNANFYMVFNSPHDEERYLGFFCQEHWEKALAWVAQREIAPGPFATGPFGAGTNPPDG